MRLFGYDIRRRRQPSGQTRGRSADPARKALATRFLQMFNGGRQAQAKYDAAQTTDENRRHWANADLLSADAAANAGVRATLRQRARYERANNSYCLGMVNTLANDIIGTGPRLQLQSPVSEANSTVERAFSEWSRSIGLAEKLRTMRMARTVDGEAFGVLVDNPAGLHPVKLDLRLIEADQITTPTLRFNSKDQVDGITFDSHGNPKLYHVLKAHPGGDQVIIGSGTSTDDIRAENMIHLFRTDRPGQSRGIPDITPALPLFSMLRRYTLAVLGAAETAASFAAVLQTATLPEDDPDPVEAGDAFEIELRNLVTMPQGWQMNQMKAEQPVTTYQEFVNAILSEIARCLNMPFNVAAGNSKDYNYASGRLDHQVYFKSIRVDQDHIERVVLDRIFAAWLDEAVLLEDMIPQVFRTKTRPPHKWHWDGQEHVDPLKEAAAQKIRLENNTTTLAREIGTKGDGHDWEEWLKQRGKERAFERELDIVPPESAILIDARDDDEVKDKA